MKKRLLSILLTLVIGMSLIACGAENSEVVNEVSTEKIVEEESALDAEAEDSNEVVEEADDTDESDSNMEKFLNTLKPTHEKNADFPFAVCDRFYASMWMPGQDITDISHLTNGYYSIRPSYIFQQTEEYVADSYDNLTWEQLKGLKVSYLEEEEIWIYFEVAEGNERRIVVDIPYTAVELDLTVEEAVDQGYYNYYYQAYEYYDWDDFFATEAQDEAQEDNYLQAMIELWGQPTEVYYDAMRFELLYETENNKIYMAGYSGKYFSVPQLNFVFVHGKNSDVEEGWLSDNQLP